MSDRISFEWIQFVFQNCFDHRNCKVKMWILFHWFPSYRLKCCNILKWFQLNLFISLFRGHATLIDTFLWIILFNKLKFNHPYSSLSWGHPNTFILASIISNNGSIFLDTAFCSTACKNCGIYCWISLSFRLRSNMFRIYRKIEDFNERFRIGFLEIYRI